MDRRSSQMNQMTTSSLSEPVIINLAWALLCQLSNENCHTKIKLVCMTSIHFRSQPAILSLPVLQVHKKWIKENSCSSDFVPASQNTVVGNQANDFRLQSAESAHTSLPAASREVNTWWEPGRLLKSEGYAVFDTNLPSQLSQNNVAQAI